MLALHLACTIACPEHSKKQLCKLENTKMNLNFSSKIFLCLPDVCLHRSQFPCPKVRFLGGGQCNATWVQIGALGRHV